MPLALYLLAMVVMFAMGTSEFMLAEVPGGSVLGTVLGWRAAFWAVAAG